MRSRCHAVLGRGHERGRYIIASWLYIVEARLYIIEARLYIVAS